METLRKLYILLLLLFSSYVLSAQVLITDEVTESPSTIDPNALVEMRTTSVSDPGGLIIPKVDFAYSGGEVILENMETPTDGIMVFNIGTNVDKGLWYYDEELGRWVIYTKPGSMFSASIDNYGEYYQAEPSGLVVDVPIASWLPWNSASYDPVAMGSRFDPLDDYLVDIGGGVLLPSDVLVANDAGIYQVSLYSVFMRMSTNMSFEATLHINDLPQYKLRMITTLQSNGSYVSASANGIISVQAGDVIDIRFKALPGLGGQVELYNMNMTLEKIGD